jgi:hypothetical protein
MSRVLKNGAGGHAARATDSALNQQDDLSLMVACAILQRAARLARRELSKEIA